MTVNLKKLKEVKMTVVEYFEFNRLMWEVKQKGLQEMIDYDMAITDFEKELVENEKRRCQEWMDHYNEMLKGL